MELNKDKMSSNSHCKASLKDIFKLANQISKEFEKKPEKAQELLQNFKEMGLSFEK